MLVKKKIRRQVEVVKEAVCNQCKGLCLVDEQMYGLSAEVSGDYDMVTYRFELCEKCLSELFAGFKIPPDKEGLYIGEEDR